MLRRAASKPTSSPRRTTPREREIEEILREQPVTLEDQIGEGDKVVNRWTVRGTHRGEFQGVAPTGKEVEFTGNHLSRINEEGKLQASWENYDDLGLMRQIDASPAPE